MPETSSSCAGPGGPLAPLGGQCPGVEARNKAGCGSASHGARGIFSGERLQGHRTGRVWSLWGSPFAHGGDYVATRLAEGGVRAGPPGPGIAVPYTRPDIG